MAVSTRTCICTLVALSIENTSDYVGFLVRFVNFVWFLLARLTGSARGRPLHRCAGEACLLRKGIAGSGTMSVHIIDFRLGCCLHWWFCSFLPCSSCLCCVFTCALSLSLFFSSRFISSLFISSSFQQLRAYSEQATAKGKGHGLGHQGLQRLRGSYKHCRREAAWWERPTRQGWQTSSKNGTTWSREGIRPGTPPQAGQS